MNNFAEILDDFEECIKLITQDKPNKSILAIILIDSLMDIYSHRYIEAKKDEEYYHLTIYKKMARINSSDIIKEKIEESSQKILYIKKIVNKFDKRVKWFVEKNYISDEAYKAICILHDYRNQYLHRLKRKERDSIAYARLYFSLFQSLFIALPLNGISLKDCENNEILNQFFSKHVFNFTKVEFRTELVSCLNSKYKLAFDREQFLRLLYEFLFSKYNNLIETLDYIIENSYDKKEIIEQLESECNTGKIIFTSSESWTSARLQKILGDVRKILSYGNEHDGLSKFNEIYTKIEDYEKPILRLGDIIEQRIQLEFDCIRGK